MGRRYTVAGYKRGLAMTKPDKTETEVHAPTERRTWKRPTMRSLSVSATATGGASPQTDLGVTFS